MSYVPLASSEHLRNKGINIVLLIAFPMHFSQPSQVSGTVYREVHACVSEMCKIRTPMFFVSISTK